MLSDRTFTKLVSYEKKDAKYLDPGRPKRGLTDYRLLANIVKLVR